MRAVRRGTGRGGNTVREVGTRAFRIDITALLFYTGRGMVMSTTRDDESQQSMWVSVADLVRPRWHLFYERLNGILEAAGFDAFVEGLCARFYATKWASRVLLRGATSAGC